jgi:hypothetical protein
VLKAFIRAFGNKVDENMVNEIWGCYSKLRILPSSHAYAEMVLALTKLGTPEVAFNLASEHAQDAIKFPQQPMLRKFPKIFVEHVISRPEICNRDITTFYEARRRWGVLLTVDENSVMTSADVQIFLDDLAVFQR